MSTPKNVSELKGAPYNPRTITKDQAQALMKSLAKFGDLSGIVFNKRTGQLVGGHQRVKHLDQSWPIELSETPLTDADKAAGTVAIGHVVTPYGRLHYRVVDWDQRMEAAGNVAANKHGGDWDIPKLKDIVGELNDGAFDLDLLGFDAKELAALVDYAGKAGIVDEPSVGSDKAKSEVRCRLTADQSATVNAAMKLALGDLGSHLDREDANGIALFKLAEFYLNHHPGANA